MKKQTLLITGAGGVVGKELLSRFTQQHDFDHIIVLLHKKQLIQSTRQITVLYGDITKHNLGLTEAEFLALTQTVTAIIHCAANVTFSLPLEEAMLVNYEGTVKVTNFAEQCKQLEKYAVVSTTYVAGKRSGVITEQELEHQAGFVNTYEASKYQTEVYLQAKKKSLPIIIFRLSTIIGRSDGSVSTFHGIHLAIKLYYHSLAPFIPAVPGSLVDLVSLDFVTDAMYYLFTKHFMPGTTYHLVSGKEHSLPIEELLDETYQTFIEHDPDWRKKTIEKPALVDLSTFALFSESTKELQNPVFLRVIRSMETFAPQLLYPKQFDHTNADVLVDDKILPRPVKEYYGKVVRYCLLSNWGKRKIVTL